MWAEFFARSATCFSRVEIFCPVERAGFDPFNADFLDGQVGNQTVGMLAPLGCCRDDDSASEWFFTRSGDERGDVVLVDGAVLVVKLALDGGAAIGVPIFTSEQTA